MKFYSFYSIPLLFFFSFPKLDAKKSPLALLAQTCSNIGVDTSNNNKLLGLDKSKDSHGHSSDRKKTSSSSSVNSSSSSVAPDDNSNCGSSSSGNNNNSSNNNPVKLSFKPYESQVTSKKVSNVKNNVGERNGDTNNSAFEIISDKKNSAFKTSSSPKHNSNGSPQIGQNGKNSPIERSSSKETPNKTSSNSNNTSQPSPTTSSLASSGTSSALSYTSVGLPDIMLNGHHKDPLSSLSSLAAYKGANSLSSNCCPPNGVGHLPPLNVDKNGVYPSIYPPLSFARMKQQNGSQPMMPMCRDPYCGGSCQLSAMQNAALLAAAASASSSCTPGTCPNGCNQCDHQRLMSSIMSRCQLTHPSLIPGLSQGFGSSYYPSLSSNLARPGGNVCSWVVGDTQCGKRFATGEELLQHLRTHTSPSSDPSSVISSIPSLMSYGSTLSACHMPQYSMAGSVPPPSLTTAAGLRRTYPTSLSPLSNRFHPYKPPTIPSLNSMPPVPPGTSVPPSMASLHNSAALSMYYSPYGLYSGRLGPPVHP